MIKAFLKVILQLFTSILDQVFSLIFAVLPINFDNLLGTHLVQLSTYLQAFYSKMISAITYARYILDLNSFEMQIIVEILSVRILYKPALFVAKMLIKWWKNIKL